MRTTASFRRPTSGGSFPRLPILAAAEKTESPPRSGRYLPCACRRSFFRRGTIRFHREEYRRSSGGPVCSGPFLKGFCREPASRRGSYPWQCCPTCIGGASRRGTILNRKIGRAHV